LALAVSLIASERVDIVNGVLPAPGSSHCIRLHATGTFEHATVRVNGVNAGELATPSSELDITGYLSTGAANTVRLEPRDGTLGIVWAWSSPLVYIASARFDPRTHSLEVTVTNTTENTAQVEVGPDQQFTVSPGTSATKQIPWTSAQHRVHMRAVSDGLDREFVDEADVATVERQ
jgi:hypothetical protein